MTEFGDKRQASAHSFNGLPWSGDHQVGAFFEFGNAVLPNAQFLGHAYLCDLTDTAKFLQGHFLGNEVSSAGLHSLVASRA
jgi:hypothetical protein